MDTPISRIRKNASEEIWISLTQYQGHDLLSIRAYFRGIDGFQPTRKGVALGISKLKQVRDALATCLSSNMSDVITVAKNSSEEIRIFKGDYKGHLLMNIRVYFHRNSQEEFMPSHKGIAFNVNLTNEIIRGIDLAMRQPNCVSKA